MSFEVYIIILLIAIPVYFGCKWVLGKLKMGKDGNRKYIAVVPTVILSPLLYVCIVTIWLFSASYYMEQAFQREIWIEDVEHRYKMSASLIENEMLIGKTKEEVVSLLGEDFYSYNENYIGYYLGYVPGLAKIDPDILDIFFEDGRVIEVGQHES